MEHPSLSRQKNCFFGGGPIGGFEGLVPPKLCQNSFVLKISTDTKKSSALAYGVEKVIFGASSQRMKPDTL